MPEAFGGHKPAGVANAINEHGEIAGQTLCTGPDDPARCSLAVYWDADHNEQPITVGYSADINDWGWVVGGWSPSAGVGSAFLWSEEIGLLALNELISPSDPFFGSMPFKAGTSINNNGWIIADHQYLLKSFTTTPLPEPGTSALWALGLALIICGRPKRKPVCEQPPSVRR